MDCSRQLGEQIAYSKISSLINHLRSNVFIGIGSAIKKYASFFENGFFNTTEEFIKALKEFDFNQKAILLKGARKFKFEKMVAELERKHMKLSLQSTLKIK